MDDWKKQLEKAIDAEEISSESNIEDFANKHHVPHKDAILYFFSYLAQKDTRNTSCEGCQNAPFFGSGMFPCNSCKRRKKDYFKPSETAAANEGNKGQTEEWQNQLKKRIMAGHVCTSSDIEWFANTKRLSILVVCDVALSYLGQLKKSKTASAELKKTPLWKWYDSTH